MKLPVCTVAVKSVLDAQLAAGGLNITFDELKQKGFDKVPFKHPKYHNGGFKTPTGKIELYSTRFEHWLRTAAVLRRAAGKPDQHARNRRTISFGADDGREDLILFQLATSPTRKTSQGSTRSHCGNPS